MGVRARVSRCSLQRRPRRDGEEAHLGLGELRAPLVRSNWLYELSAQQRAHRANWILRARPGSKVRVALSAPLKRLLEPGELRLREKDHANVAVTSTWKAFESARQIPVSRHDSITSFENLAGRTRRAKTRTSCENESDGDQRDALHHVSLANRDFTKPREVRAVWRNTLACSHD